MALKRIEKELNEILIHPPEWIGVNSEDKFHWQVTMICPEDSPYADGVFFLDVRFPGDYPFKPPKIFFVTKIYHPNICPSTGEVCLTSCGCSSCRHFLGWGWSPALTIKQVLRDIYLLLVNPDFSSPFNEKVAAVYNQDKEKFKQIAKEWTKKYAM